MAYPEFCDRGCVACNGVVTAKICIGEEGLRSDIEKLKASRGGEWGGGVPLPSRLQDLGSAESTSAGFGAKPRQNTFWCISSLEEQV